MCAAFGDVCTLASDLLICAELYCDICQSCLLFFCVCRVSLCFTCSFYFIFYGKKFDLNLFDISARLSVFCAFMLDVEIRFHCFDSVVWSSRNPSAYVSIYVCISSDRLRTMCNTHCSVLRVWRWCLWNSCTKLT